MKFNNNTNGLTERQTSSFNSVEYEIEQSRKLDELRQKYTKDDGARQKAIVDQVFAYKKSKLDAEYQLQITAALNIKKLEEQLAKAKTNKEKENLNKRIANEKSFLQTVSKLEKLEDEKRQKVDAQSQAAKILKMSKKDRQAAGITDAEYKQAKEVYKATQDIWGEDGTLTKVLSSITKLIDKQVEDISKYQSRWDTRLQGSGLTFENSWNRQGISSKLSGIVGASPLIQTEKVFQNVDKLVDKGIAYNVEQRAFLATISDKIATTFDVANGTLLQLIRVQQSDTTAARLGMESTLNTYLNSMYQNSEYLSDVFDNVSSNLYEATSQMGSKMGVEFEYEVQKWLGSLYSVGMSSNSIQNLANAIGMLGSGNVSGLANSGMQNIIVMAASKMGKSYGELLTGGLDANTTNQLLESIVEYLADISKSDNKVVKSQLASVFGITMSDLTAVSNLISSSKDIANVSLTYNKAIEQLNSMANSMYARTSTGELLSNIWENIQYGVSTGIATNPALFALWKVANTLDDTMQGIAIPAISVLGNMVDLETNIASLMKVGALSGGLLSSIGTMIGGISSGSAGGFSGSGMLKALGINTNISSVSRGASVSTGVSGINVSQSAYNAVGNTASGDIYNASIAGASDQKNALMASAKEEDNSATLDIVDTHIVDIYNLLNSIISGNALTVKVQNYGLSLN